MKFCRSAIFFAALIFALVRPTARAAGDPEIDRLLKKLPPPEKLVQVDERVLRVTDPAMRDPLVKQIAEATRAKKMKRSLELSQQLATRYPSSAGPWTYCGLLELQLGRYADAAAAFRRALAIQPKFVLCHYCLATAEWHLRNPAAALPHIRQVTKLEPHAAAGWAFLSVCAQTVGERAESVAAAQHLTALEPRQPASWFRLAVAEQSVGNHAEAQRAMNRAVYTARVAKAAAQKTSAAKKKN